MPDNLDELRRMLLLWGVAVPDEKSDEKPDGADGTGNSNQTENSNKTENSDEMLMALVLERAGQKLAGELGEDELPESLRGVMLDMAAGEYLMTKLALSPQAFKDWQPDVKNLRMGDVSVGYAAEGCGGRAGVFQFANGLLMRVREMLVAVRGVKW